jgi:transposase
MRKIKEILRLKWSSGLSNRQIAQSCVMARSTVAEYLRRAQAAGLSWPLPAEWDDVSLEELLFPPAAYIPAAERPVPNWAEIHREYKRKGVTLSLLWQEYKAQSPAGYQYSQFCERYRAWTGRLDPCMRQEHKAGEKLFVDYAGQTVPVMDATTGEVRPAQIFLAVLGASNYTYVEATWSQTLPDWIGSHVRALAFFGGVPAVIVPDNLKSGVTKPCRYEPDINLTYQELSDHYGTAILPARVRKPKDKAKVENGVLVAERWLLAPLRNRQFFSLVELNQALGELLLTLNQRPFQKMPGSRQSLFETLERPALLPLPLMPYQYGEWKKALVNVDYHLEADGHYYSVPYQLIKEQVEIRLSQKTVECFHLGKRVASHVRSYDPGKYTTLPEHRSPAHRYYLEWTPEKIVQWAETIGPEASSLAKAIMQSRPHPQQGVNSCLGIVKLAKEYGAERLEAACHRALAIQALSYKSLKSILKHGLDKWSLPASPRPLFHANVRGPQYYH